jgi:hypothetical protein
VQLVDAESWLTVPGITGRTGGPGGDGGCRQAR